MRVLFQGNTIAFLQGKPARALACSYPPFGAPDTQHNKENCCLSGAAFTTRGRGTQGSSLCPRRRDGFGHGGTAGVMCRSCLGCCCHRRSWQGMGTPAADGSSRRQAGMKKLGKPLLPGQGEETCCWHGSAPFSRGPKSPLTDQLTFLCFLLLFDKHLTHTKMSPSTSLLRDICLLQCCRHRHISECVLFQINGPSRQPGKTYHPAVTARQVHPACLPRGQAIQSHSSGSSK